MDGANQERPSGDWKRRQAQRLMPVVQRLAGNLKKRLPKHVDFDDLVGAGSLGLAKALDKWSGGDPGALEAYVVKRVMGAMLDELRAADPLTKAQRKANARILLAERDLANQLGRAPEPHEVAAHLGIPEASYHETRLAAFAQHTVEMPATTSCWPGRHAPVASLPPSPEQQLAKAQRDVKMAKALGALPDRLQRVLHMQVQDEASLKEIGSELGVTEARACQLRKEAVQTLQRYCRTTAPPPNYVPPRPAAHRVIAPPPLASTKLGSASHSCAPPPLDADD